MFPVEIERAFNTCVYEVRKHKHARVRAQISSLRAQISSPNRK